MQKNQSSGFLALERTLNSTHEGNPSIESFTWNSHVMNSPFKMTYQYLDHEGTLHLAKGVYERESWNGDLSWETYNT